MTTTKNRMMLFGFVVVVIANCIGCASRQLVLHPIQPTDFYVVEGGERDGDVCMSEFYFEKVLKAKLDAK